MASEAEAMAPAATGSPLELLLGARLAILAANFIYTPTIV